MKKEAQKKKEAIKEARAVKEHNTSNAQKSHTSIIYNVAKVVGC